MKKEHEWLITPLVILGVLLAVVFMFFGTPILDYYASTWYHGWMVRERLENCKIYKEAGVHHPEYNPRPKPEDRP